MKILVTGSEGVIGKELVGLLPDHQLMCLDKRETAKYTLDLSQDYFAKLQEIKMFKPEAIVHLAASFERTEETPEFYERNRNDNVLASLILNRELVGLDSVKCFVFASSYLVYNPRKYIGVENASPILEHDEVSPRNLCGVAKYYNERELQFIQSHIKPDMRLCLARIYRVYGKDSMDFVSNCCRWALSGKTVQVWNAKNRFDYIHAYDVATALKTMVFSTASGIYNVSTGHGSSIQKVLDLTGVSYEPVDKDMPSENSQGSFDKLARDTGWGPSINLQQGIANLKEYYKKRC